MSAVPAPQAGAVPGRARGFLSGAREIDAAVVDTQGALPSWLAGTLLLNGPALWELPGGRLDHWFDGYAMWHALCIDGAGVRYRSRFCASESYRRSVTAGGRSAARDARSSWNAQACARWWRSNGVQGAGPSRTRGNAAWRRRSGATR